MGILDGVRVVDLSNFLAAPTCGRLLGEWGAEVIKVEPIKGDTYRSFGPTMRMPVTEKANPNYDMHNAGKQFFSVDFRSEEGMEALHRLLATADVFITNNRPQALEAMKLDWDSLKERYPSLIFAHVLGYGEKGPLCNKPGFDFTAFWARSGLMADIAPVDGDPTNGIVGMGDHSVTLAITGAICGALFNRTRTGKGEKIDSSLLQCATWLNMSTLNSVHFGLQLPRSRKSPNQAANNVYRCRDGEWIYLACTDYNRLYGKLCTEVLGRPDLAENSRYSTRAEYLKNREELTEIFDEIFLTRDRSEWDELLNKADISHEIVQHFSDVLKDPQVLENRYVVYHTYEDGTTAPFCPPPVHIGSIDYTSYRLVESRPAGADNDRYLEELGYSRQQIQALRDKGAIK